MMIILMKLIIKSIEIDCFLALSQSNFFSLSFDLTEFSKRGNLRNTILNIKITLFNAESDP